MKRLLVLALTVVLVVSLALACGSTPTPTATTKPVAPSTATMPPPPPPTTTAAPRPTATVPAPTATSAPAVTVIDDLGKSLTFVKPPERIVSIAPSVTEILFAIGAGNRVVGVSDFTTYPPEAAKLPAVGGMPLNYEKVVSLKPDLVIGADTTSADDISKMTSLGLKVLVINKTDLEGIFGDIELIGKAAGVQSAAADLASSMRKDLAALKTEIAAAKTKPRVFVELDETLYTVGPGSFIQPLIELAGGANIAADAKSAYPQFSVEQVIARDPEIILLADAAYGMTSDTVRARQGWDKIAAVKNNAVFPVDSDTISRPGPRIVKALRQMASLIHPELNIGK